MLLKAAFLALKGSGKLRVSATWKYIQQHIRNRTLLPFKGKHLAASIYRPRKRN